VACGGQLETPVADFRQLYHQFLVAKRGIDGELLQGAI